MLKILNLRTEYKANPIGIGIQDPRMSWQLHSGKRNTVQTHYRIIAASTKEGLTSNKECLWDTGKTASYQSVHIPYCGPQLKSGQRVFWSVHVWDNHGNEAQSEELAFWEMGIADNKEWKADWISPNIPEDTSKSTPCAFLRKEFLLNKEIRKATIYASALGLYHLHLNGEKVSDHLFTPGWTSYHKRIQYQAYDITKQLLKGENCLGAVLGDGWYRGYLGWQGNKNTYGDKLALIVQLKVTFSDGTETFILSDNTWKSTTGPILQSDIYNGEIYDARKELTGWEGVAYNDNGWSTVNILDHPKSILVASEGSPVRITKTIKPIAKITTPKGETVFDLGQNIVGWVQFSLKGKKGAKITLNHAEVLDREGNFYTGNLRAAKAEYSYIFKGDGVETYEPHFTFHGFRYIKVSDYPGEISTDDICGKVIHSDMEPIGEFTCSNEMVNQLQKNIEWGMRGNFLDVPTDCPQRDERMGWTGDAQVFAPTANFNFNTAPFFTKWMKDLIGDQKSDGSVPWVVPNVVKDGGGTGWSDGYGATGWADAAILIPWSVYLAYGDKQILQTQYGSMKDWVGYMIKHAGERYIFDYGFHFGDWLSFAEYYSYNYNAPDYGYAGAYTEKDLIATAYFYHSTSVLSKVASLLGKNEDAAYFADFLPRIKSAFQQEFVTSSGRLVSGTQTAYTLALSFGLIPEEFIETAAKRLADDVRYFGHLTTGFLGTPLLCQALTEHGYADLAYKLLFNKRYPSWLYPITMGATTIWERWDGIKPDGSFQTEGMNSFNHYAYGAVGQWLYTTVAGINAAEDAPGYKHIILKPYLTGQLNFAEASLNTMYGKVISRWEQNDNTFLMNIVIPPNAQATVQLPVKKLLNVTENGQDVLSTGDIEATVNKDGHYFLKIGSGKYLVEMEMVD